VGIITITDTNPIFKAKQDMVILIEDRIAKKYYGNNHLENHNYQNDLIRLAELEELVRQRTIDNLKKAQNVAHKTIVEKTAESDKRTPAFLRRCINTKYQTLIKQYGEIQDVLAKNVERKKQCRELKDKLFLTLKKKKEGKQLTPKDREIINEILGF